MAKHLEQKVISFSRNQIKAIIAITMVVDHIGFVLFSPLQNVSFMSLNFPLPYYLLRLVGRLAFPLVCFFLVEGMRHTHDRRKYLLRLLLFALVSEVPFDLAMYGQLSYWGGQNVLFTLAIGLCMLYLLEQAGQMAVMAARIRASLFIVVGAMALAYIAQVDYSYWGILMILVFYPEHLQRKHRFWLMLIVCAGQGVMELFAVASLFFIENYSGEKGGGQSRFQQYFFYLFYPLHLMVLYGVWISTVF